MNPTKKLLEDCKKYDSGDLYTNIDLFKEVINKIKLRLTDLIKVPHKPVKKVILA